MLSLPFTFLSQVESGHRGNFAVFKVWGKGFPVLPCVVLISAFAMGASKSALHPFNHLPTNSVIPLMVERGQPVGGLPGL